ncbi:MAG: hypothetical protein CVU41_11880 [Chloroflexi bacterium HGW-Chloroflexi-3]|nr:MAG: hypothetical protein CVU41_11880 [Chloroflexi bacterium HGW-Chloroflexi-3]
MKKIIVVVGILIAVLAIGGSIWVVSAQSTDPQNPTCPGYSDGAYPGGYGMRGRGMMGSFYGQNAQTGCLAGDVDNPMHTAMITYFADALGLSEDELNTRLSDGESLYAIAAAADFSEEEIYALMQEFHTSYWESADVDSEFFQNRYERMQERWSGEGSSGYPVGGCHGYGRPGNWGSMMRWFQPES